MYATTPSITRPMFIVFVSRTGTSSAPCVSIQMLPVISPVPFSTQVAAGTLSRHRSPPCGRIAVTPVRTGPCPGTSFPSPRTSVTCPTRTPFTSVIASSGPGAMRPMTIPSSRSRFLGPSPLWPGVARAAVPAAGPAVATAAAPAADVAGRSAGPDPPAQSVIAHAAIAQQTREARRRGEKPRAEDHDARTRERSKSIRPPCRRAPGPRAMAFSARRSAPAADDPVFPGLPERLPAGDAVHAPSRVRGGRAVVQAADRRAVVGVAGGGAHVEQLVDRQLAVEDVAADQPQLLLHVVRPDHLPVDDRAPEVGRQLGIEV